MTFIGSAAALNRSWGTIDVYWPKQATDSVATNVAYGRLDMSSLRTQNCRWRLCLKIPRKRLGVSLLGPAANAQHCMHVGQGQPVEAPTQTSERTEKALMTLQSIERFACAQHDRVSFAKAWMLMSKGVTHELDYDFTLVPPAVMAPLQRRLEGGLRQTMSLEVWASGLLR